MKHPAYRCSDILFMDKDAMKRLFDHVWWACECLPFYDKIEDIELVGSYAFGTNKLGSDADFNIALKDYNDQIPAKQWFYTPPNRAELTDRLFEFERTYGLHIDIGCVDPNSIKYNVVASTKKFELYNRGRDPLPIRQPGRAVVYEYPLFSAEPMSTIDLLTFDPATDSVPDTFKQHLMFDAYLYYFVGQDRSFARRSMWDADEWADIVDEWRAKYGDRFEDYHEENGHLIAD